MLVVGKKIEDHNDQIMDAILGEPFSNDYAVVSHHLHNRENIDNSYYYNDSRLILDSYRKRLNSKNEGFDYDCFFNELTKREITPPFLPKSNYSFKFIDLFAGIGGFRLALQNLNGKCIYSSEWDLNAKKTYKANFGEVPFGDITDPNIKGYIPADFDILCAGFPCQAFSIAGEQKGFSDTRGTLFFDIEKIVEIHRPKVVFLENVKNLISHDKGNTLKVILEILEDKLGYNVYYKILNSMTHANIPQNRERIFIVGFDQDRVPNHHSFEFPKQIKLTKTIHDFLEEEEVAERYYYQKSHKYYPELRSSVKSRDTVYQWRRVYVRENKSNVCPTLTANMGTGGHNVPIILDGFGIRKLTPKECFALQGYPMDEFVIPEIANSKLYMQAGNSVTTPLVERIAKNILQVL